MVNKKPLVTVLVLIPTFLMACTFLQIDFSNEVTSPPTAELPHATVTSPPQPTSIVDNPPPMLTAPPQVTQTNLPVVPQFINHPQLDLSVESIPIEKAGCPMDANGYYTCHPGSPIANLGCTDVQFADYMLGGLTPRLPLLICNIRPNQENPAQNIDDEGYLWVEGGLMPVFHRLVVEQDGQFILIKNLEELQSFFSPVETEEEALSYAVLATGLTPSYGEKYFPDLRYLVPVIEDTHIVRTENGFEINLFGNNIFGCGNHGTFTMPVSVSVDGKVEKGEYIQIDEDPRMDGLCVD